MKAILLATSVLFVLSTTAYSKAFTTLKKDSKTSPVEYGTITRHIVKVAGQGGSDGIDFDDFDPLKYIIAIHSISISYSDHINSIAVTYITAGGQLHTGPVHGQPISPVINITLGPSEHIWRVEGQTDGWYITQLTFRTIGLGNDHRTYGPYGNSAATKFFFEKHVIAFHGGSVISLNKIGVYGLPSLNTSVTHGGSGGSNFDDSVRTQIPAVVGIGKIMVWNARIVDAVQVEFITLAGGTLLGGKHGEGGSKNRTTIYLREGDSVNSLIVATQETRDNTLVSQLTFKIKKGNGEIVTHGPFGTLGFDPVTYTGNILGFYGSAGLQIDKIGVYLV